MKRLLNRTAVWTLMTTGFLIGAKGCSRDDSAADFSRDYRGLIYDRFDRSTANFRRYDIRDANDIRRVRDAVASVVNLNKKMDRDEDVLLSTGHRLRFTDSAGSTKLSVQIRGDNILVYDDDQFFAADSVTALLAQLIANGSANMPANAN